MPRRSINQGGTRVGAPGAAYPNRTDLNQNKSLPVRVATGQTYGKAQQQIQAQQTVPMGPTPLAGFPQGGPPLPPLPPGQQPMPGAGGPPLGGPPMVGPQQVPPIAPPGQGPMIPAGGLGPYGGPTTRPNEPVTAGLSIGAGPGPEALAPPPAGPGVGGGMSDMLSRAAATTGSATLAGLAQRAQAAGL